MSKVIGIDLGTTNTVAAVIEGGEPVIIPTRENYRLLPSVVAMQEGRRFVGSTARNQAITNPVNTIYSIKRFMGRRYDDPEVRHMATRIPYRITAAPNGDVRVQMAGRTFSPPEISAMILQRIKMNAESFLGQPVTEAVITVPAYFDATQRKATQDAGRIAGLNVRRIINEPTASSLAYHMDEQEEGQIIAVYDMGGGTFDITILEVSEGLFRVLSTHGDTHLGGDDVDQAIVGWLLAEYERQYHVSLPANPQVLGRLRDAAETAKIALSAQENADINLPFISGQTHLQTTLTRPQLDQLAATQIESSLDHCQVALANADLDRSAIDQVLLVGGMSRMPLIEWKVTQFFGKKPRRLPNPEEAVAIGAAIQGGVLAGEVRDVLLLDVTPLTLSIEKEGGLAEPFVRRNTTIPVTRRQIVTTAENNQTEVTIRVYQGERPVARDNRRLGSFKLTGIRPAPRGVPQIEVTFDIDTDGILNVSAVDQETGQAERITIIPSSGLNEVEIASMIREAEDYAALDDRREQEIEARVNAEGRDYAEARRHYGTGPLGDQPVHLQPAGQQAAVSAFLAYAPEDGLEMARKLADDLSARGFRIFWDQGQPPAPDDFGAMERAIAEADVLIVILTPAAPDVRHIHYACQHAIIKCGKYVIPLLTEGFNTLYIPRILNHTRPVDARQGYDTALTHLIRVLTEFQSW